MKRYECPECGSKVIVLTLTSMPPQTSYRCTNCDYHHVEKQELETETVTTPQ